MLCNRPWNEKTWPIHAIQLYRCTLLRFDNFSLIGIIFARFKITIMQLLLISKDKEVNQIKKITKMNHCAMGLPRKSESTFVLSRTKNSFTNAILGMYSGGAQWLDGIDNDNKVQSVAFPAIHIASFCLVFVRFNYSKTPWAKVILVIDRLRGWLHFPPFT